MYNKSSFSSGIMMFTMSNDMWSYTFITLFFITFFHLLCNKSANFVILNVILQKIIIERKKIKPNKYQLKSDLTGSIWLAEDDPRSSQLKSDFSESIRLI